MADVQTRGLNCPSCGSVVPVPEGDRIVQCPSCDQRSLVQGEQGLRRWMVPRTIDRDTATESVERFFGGARKASALKSEARIREVFCVYLPFWRVASLVSGWVFGRVRAGKDTTKPAEVQIGQEMRWSDAAVDVSEFGIHRVSINEDDLQPFDAERMQREAMVFEPTESRMEALAEAEQYFQLRARSQSRFKRISYVKVRALRSRLSLVYYPLWVARYEYRNRSYQVVADGVSGRVLYGKAPGNILFRAAALVGGVAAGTFTLVNGTLLALPFALDSDEALVLLALPVAVGAALIWAGYRAFRYGGEVEELQPGAKKALHADGDKLHVRLGEFLR